MYIIKNKCYSFLYFFLLVVSCTTSKELVDTNNIIGHYVNNSRKISLNIKTDNTFLLKQDLLREFCLGSWELKGNTLILNCKKPKYIIDFLTSYNIVTDTIYFCKVKAENKILYKNRILKK